METSFRSCVSSFVAFTLFLSTPAPLFASEAPASPDSAQATEEMAPEDAAQTSNDMMLLYWGELMEKDPTMAEFLLGGEGDETPYWQVQNGDPLLDADPFFMRSQEWQGTANCEDNAELCYMKDRPGRVTFSYQGRALTLNQPLTPVLETDTHILLTADDTSLFDAKVATDKDKDESPGEGLFYINKADFPRAASFSSSVPVYFFPLPGPGWTGPNPHAFENAVARQIVIYDHDGFGLPIDQTDLETMEHVEYQNLALGQTWSALDGDVNENGVALPKPNTTLAFGMFFSGQLPNRQNDQASNGRAGRAFDKIAAQLQILPKAEALRGSPSLFARLTKAFEARTSEIEKQRKSTEGAQQQLPMYLPSQMKPAPAPPKRGFFGRVTDWAKGVVAKGKAILQDRKEAKVQKELDLKPVPKPVDPAKRPAWRRWITPGILYSTRFGAAAALASTFDWSSLITADMPTRIMNVSMIFGAILAASITLKYTVHKALFDKKYPKTPDETALQRLNKEHKGVFDELSHGLWFASAMLPQWIRHNLDFLKDRFLPSNKIVHTAWEATMGFMMRASSRLAMNWKTFWLGAIVFGGADSINTTIDIAIIAPWLLHKFGFHMGAATAAFVSATALTQFVLYFLQGSHGYSQDQKTLYMQAAETEAKRKMRTSGMNPDAPKNDGMRLKLTAIELEKRFKMVGLPGKEEFLYDPITILENAARKSGYGPAAELTEADKTKLANKDFALSRRHWGLVKPALQRAIEAARQAQDKSPSPTGAQVIQLLEWASSNRSGVSAVAGRAWDVTSSQWGAEELQASMQKTLEEDLKADKNPTAYKAIKSALRGAFKYLGSDATAEARDIRSALFLMSTSGSPLDVAEFLPQRWKDHAGSEEASLLGAELFHRAFHSYLEFDEGKVLPTSELEAQYGARVQGIMARIDRRQPDLLKDPFAREIRSWELMSRLQQKEKERKAIMSYDPNNAKTRIGRALKDYELQQWEIAREEAAKRLTDDADTDTQVSREWMGMADLYRVKTDTGDRREALDLTDWARSYKFRTVVAQEITKRVGLYVEDPEKSELVQKVVVSAAVATEGQLATKEERIYMSRLTDDDRRFYEAQIFSRHFINNYIDTAVRSDVKEGDGILSTSPEFPGRFQKVRQNLIGRRGGEPAAATLRFFESFFRNEESSYAPTLWGWMDRNIPLIPDLYHNFTRNLRFLPYAFLIGWPVSYYIWQLHVPYVMYMLSIALGFIHPALVEINNRVMRNYDIKPMEDVPSKLTFAWNHSLFTNPVAMAEVGATETVVGGVNRLIRGCEDLLMK